MGLSWRLQQNGGPHGRWAVKRLSRCFCGNCFFFLLLGLSLLVCEMG